MLALSRNAGYVVCLVIIVFDIIAGILGIEAEEAQKKTKQVQMGLLECRLPSPQAYKLAFTAAVFLSLAHLVANLLGGCICLKSPADTKRVHAYRQIAIGSLVFSWIVFAVGLSLLSIGTMANSSKSKNLCGLSIQRLLLIGGFLCFFHGLFSAIYYVASSTIAQERKQHHPGAHATIGTRHGTHA